MKKLFALSLMAATVATFSTSCKKDDDDNTPTPIPTSDALTMTFDGKAWKSDILTEAGISSPFGGYNVKGDTISVMFVGTKKNGADTSFISFGVTALKSNLLGKHTITLGDESATGFYATNDENVDMANTGEINITGFDTVSNKLNGTFSATTVNMLGVQTHVISNGKLTNLTLMKGVTLE